MKIAESKTSHILGAIPGLQQIVGGLTFIAGLFKGGLDGGKWIYHRCKGDQQALQRDVEHLKQDRFALSIGFMRVIPAIGTIVSIFFAVKAHKAEKKLKKAPELIMFPQTFIHVELKENEHTSPNTIDIPSELKIDVRNEPKVDVSKLGTEELTRLLNKGKIEGGDLYLISKDQIALLDFSKLNQEAVEQLLFETHQEWKTRGGLGNFPSSRNDNIAFIPKEQITSVINKLQESDSVSRNFARLGTLLQKIDEGTFQAIDFAQLPDKVVENVWTFRSKKYVPLKTQLQYVVSKNLISDGQIRSLKNEEIKQIDFSKGSPSSNFYSRLEDLNIGQLSDFLISCPCDYVVRTNEDLQRISSDKVKQLSPRAIEKNLTYWTLIQTKAFSSKQIAYLMESNALIWNKSRYFSLEALEGISKGTMENWLNSRLCVSKSAMYEFEKDNRYKNNKDVLEHLFSEEQINVIQKIVEGK